MKKILITGAAGQIGSDLTLALRHRYGSDKVIACGHSRNLPDELRDSGPSAMLDVRDQAALTDLLALHSIDTIFHLAGILSATAEHNPDLAWDVNMNGLRTVLEAARQSRCAVFFPSSIGAFGPSTPKKNTPQVTIQRPLSIYGITKLAGELLCDYYFRALGVDTRGVRFPGLISHTAPPGGGTTDYAVEIFHAAVRGEPYRCFLRADTRLDMMYMEDAVRAAMELMEAEPARLTHRNAYNITAMSFTPEVIFREIRKTKPDFTISYAVDPIRQAIADSWPDNMDDSAARIEWGWTPRYDLAAMSREMLEKLATKAIPGR